MTDLNLTDLYYFIGGGALFLTLLVWPIFVIISIRKIEKKIVQEGKRRPCQWDPCWGRAFFYAFTLVLPTKNYSELEKNLLNPADVLPHANSLDRVLAFILFSSTWTFIICVVIGWITGIDTEH